MNIQKLFFELIRVAIGTQESLSRLPSSKEWKALYNMAKKQSIVGVCFVALQRLGADVDEGYARLGIPEDVYFYWIGMAAMIQKKNEIVNQQCAKLQAKLSADGFKSCILKGQGVGQCYVEHLRGFRQSGDIDALLWKEELSHKENREAVIQLARSIDEDATGSEHHVHAHIFEDTEVELHYEPSYFCNPWTNRRFRRWCEEHRIDMVYCKALGCIVPNTEYNLVFLLSHMFRHYVSEGVGLRQLMDYYFILLSKGEKSYENNVVLTTTGKNTNYVSAGSVNIGDVNSLTKIENKFPSVDAKSSNETDSIDETTSVKCDKNLCKVLNSLNMMKFAGAVMWIMKVVLGMPEHFMICESDERVGKKLLIHVMQGGNFGQHNTETVASKESHVGRFINQFSLDLSLAMDYPYEALWSPISMIREFLRIRI